MEETVLIQGQGNGAVGSHPAPGSRVPSDRLGASTGLLYLSAPPSGAQRTIRDALRVIGAGYEELRLGTLAVRIDGGRLGAIGAVLARALTAAELAETQTLFLADGAEPDLPELLRSQPLSRLVARLRGDWVEAVLREGRLAVHFQPIVAANAPEAVFGYECLTRGLETDGVLVPAGQLFADAAACGLLAALDERTRLAAVRAAAEHAPAGRIFVNCSPSALCDPAHDHQALLAAIAEVGLPAADLVLEIVESEAADDPTRLARVLDGYRAAGIGVALDDLAAGHSSLSVLAEIRPDFVKLDRDLIRNVDRSPLKATFARKLMEAAREEGIRVIAEGVETLAEWRWLRLYGADLVQGYLFAAPGCPPPLPRHPVMRRET